MCIYISNSLYIIILLSPQPCSIICFFLGGEMKRVHSVYLNTRGRKRRRAECVRLQCWPFFADFLELGDLVRLSVTDRASHRFAYNGRSHRAWPGVIELTYHDLQHNRRALCHVLRQFEPGQVRIGLNLSRARLSDEVSEWMPVLALVRMLGLRWLDLSWSRCTDLSITVFLSSLGAHQVDLSHSQGLCDLLFAKMSARTTSLRVKGHDLDHLNPYLTKEGAMAGLARLTRLEHLDLSEYSLIDTPTLGALQTLDRLTALDVSECHRLTSVRCLAQLTSLQTLCLNHCIQLRDASSLGSLTSLTSLGLRHCPLVNFEDLCLRKLIRLRFIDLSCNFNLGSLVELLPRGRALEAVLLDSCIGLDADDVSCALRHARRLRQLDVAWCRHIPADIPATVRSLRASVADFASLGHLHKLCSYKVASCIRSTGDRLSSLPLATLGHLELHRCDDMLEFNLACLSSATQLRSLCLTNCDLMGDLLPCFVQRLPSLRRLCYRGSNITELGLSTLRTITSLRELDLADSHKLRNDALCRLSSEMHTLNLSRCPRLTDDGFSHLASASGLHTLIVTEGDVSELQCFHLCLALPQLAIRIEQDDEDYS